MNILENKEIIKWCFQGITDQTLATTNNQVVLKPFQNQEKEWARSIIGGVGSQWTTTLCQDLVAEALIKLGRKNVRKTKKIKSSVRDKKYDPDLECDEYVYEVKGRNWTTTGTAGEKILGVPLKYGEIPRLYHKPLKIILVGYQEHEARKAFAFGDLLDSKEQTQELKDSLAFYKKHEIEYIGFTDILTELGLGKEYWDER
jgi:hypothetical protein